MSNENEETETPADAVETTDLAVDDAETVTPELVDDGVAPDFGINLHVTAEDLAMVPTVQRETKLYKRQDMLKSKLRALLEDEKSAKVDAQEAAAEQAGVVLAPELKAIEDGFAAMHKIDDRVGVCAVKSLSNVALIKKKRVLVIEVSVNHIAKGGNPTYGSDIDFSGIHVPADEKVVAAYDKCDKLAAEVADVVSRTNKVREDISKLDRISRQAQAAIVQTNLESTPAGRKYLASYNANVNLLSSGVSDEDEDDEDDSDSGS